MIRMKGFIIMAGLAAALAVGVACSNGEAATKPIEATAPSVPAVQQPVEQGRVSVGLPVSPLPPAGVVLPNSPMPPTEIRVTVPRSAASLPIGLPVLSGYPALQTNGQTGIWVNGQGKISLEPDLVLLTVGVETTGKTVAEANGKAADAMEAIVATLRSRGLEDRDIQTRSFNVFPQYEYREVTESGFRTNRQILIGFRVSNTASIKIRDLDAVGEIIDEVANAGGDSTRINGIRFTVEDTAPMMDELRALAVGDVMDKAEDYARLSGVGLGRLVFISESSAGRPIVQNFAVPRMAFAESAMDASTPIIGGELELILNVQAVFAIQ
ncbi:MAG: SIMPL domain-containing protein [Chloroflexi bacterium]|nr:SIMPL domain-containing protein [Chloroflexota bacterium]